MVSTTKFKRSKNQKEGRQNKTKEGGRTRFEKQEQGRETAFWDQPESGTRREQPADDK
jgi:hypothetical protein